MFWVYGNYKYFNSFSAVMDFSRLNLTSKVGPCAVRVNVTNLWYADIKICFIAGENLHTCDNMSHHIMYSILFVM